MVVAFELWLLMCRRALAEYTATNLTPATMFSFPEPQVGQPILGCSRLSGGFRLVRTRPPELICSGHESSRHRVPLDVSANTLKLHIGSDGVIVAFILPEGPTLTA